MKDPAELIIVRRYAASVERVYNAWIDPDKLRSWFVPHDMMNVPIVEADARPGGRYRIRMENAEGEVFTVGGVYEELVPNERLVFSWKWESGQTEMRVRIDLKDYRELTDRFDRIVSVGMFEHVGVGHYDEFFKKVNDLMDDDGVMLLHSIGHMSPPGTASRTAS